MTKKGLIPIESVQSRILLIRGEKVIIDADLGGIVRRNNESA